MNRRHFLRTTAGGTAATSLLAPSHPAAEPPKARIPIGFLGATYSHGPDKIRLAQASLDWDLIGVCEPTEAGRATCAKLGVPLISQDDLFHRAQVVAVESDVRDHAAHALLALQAGRHVHLEKPPAARLDDLRAVVAAAREKQCLLQVGFMWRYHPGFQTIREAVRQGWLGEVYHVRGFVATSAPPARRLEWSEFKGGTMFELGCHLVDATVRLLGRPKSVTPFLRHHGMFDDALMDHNVAVLEYPRATAVLTNTALQAGESPPRSFEVLGSNGTATLMPLEPPALRIDLVQPAGPYRQGPQDVPMPAFKRYVGDFAELAASVRGETSLATSLDDELIVGETVLQAAGMA